MEENKVVNTTAEATQSSEAQQTAPGLDPSKKFCKFCGQVIDKDCVICPKCGKQVEEIKSQQPQVVINNSNNNVANAINRGAAVAGPKPKNKWVALVLCFFFGAFGVHKFYEGKILLGVVYLFTLGIFGIGVLVDFIRLLFKPNPYYA